MTLLWDLYWPVAAAGLVIGIVVGWFAFPLGASRKRRYGLIAIGLAGAIGIAALWHGPLGAGERLQRMIDTRVRAELDRLELPFIKATLDQPLSRSLVLSGPADDFQREELPRYMLEIPGVAAATWSERGGYPVPLAVEAAAAGVLAFLIGLLLTYLIELRRRANAHWRW